MGLSETNSDQITLENMIKNINTSSNTHVIKASKTASRGSGVAFVINISLDNYIQKYDTYKNRLIYIDIYNKHKRTRIIQVYINSDNEDKSEILDLFKVINQWAKEAHNKQMRTIIMGDFNIRYRDYVNINKKSFTTKNHWKMEIFKTLERMKFRNVMEEYTDNPQEVITFKSSNIIRNLSCIDYIWVSDEFYTKGLIKGFYCSDIDDARTNDTTDHALLSIQLSMQEFMHNKTLFNKPRFIKVKYDYNNTSEEQWSEYKDILMTYVENGKDHFDEIKDNQNKLWNYIKNGINKSKGKLLTRTFSIEITRELKHQLLDRIYGS
jgi:exonuclease III